jgi:hypothetical protein
MEINMPLQETILKILAGGRAVEQRFVAGLSEAERVETGSLADWSAKDELAHMATWKLRRGGTFLAWMRGESLADYEEFDEINAQDYAKNIDLSWETLGLELDQGYTLLIEIVSQMTDEQLRRTPLDDTPLWRRIIGVGFIHPVYHVSDYHFRHGRVDQASGVWGEAEPVLVTLEESDVWRGVCRYNQACFYALGGQPERAVALLRDSLALNPELADLSKEDSDLDPIRARPDYLAVYED